MLFSKKIKNCFKIDWKTCNLAKSNLDTIKIHEIIKIINELLHYKWFDLKGGRQCSWSPGLKPNLFN